MKKGRNLGRILSLDPAKRGKVRDAKRISNVESRERRERESCEIVKDKATKRKSRPGADEFGNEGENKRKRERKWISKEQSIASATSTGKRNARERLCYVRVSLSGLCQTSLFTLDHTWITF